MNCFRTLALSICAIPFLTAANKETIELQRDVMTLQDQVRQLNDKVVALTTMLQSALENTKQTNVSILSMQSALNDSLKKQQDTVTGPVLNVGTKLDAMSDDFRAVRETVLDMNSRMNKLDAKIVDLQQSISVLKNPPPPPPSNMPPASMSPGPASGNSLPPITTQSASGPPPGMQAETAYTNAFRDYTGGNYDLAINEFNDFLKYYPTTQFAPNAQYYVGDIFYRRKDYDNAVIAFDAVLEHFPDNNKTPDAHLMKGRSLMALGKRDAAAREFREIVNRYPDSDSAAKAKSLLKDLGLAGPSAAKTRKRR